MYRHSCTAGTLNSNNNSDSRILYCCERSLQVLWQQIGNNGAASPCMFANRYSTEGDLQNAKREKEQEECECARLAAQVGWEGLGSGGVWWDQEGVWSLGPVRPLFL
jgi:hypothetical protein